MKKFIRKTMGTTIATALVVSSITTNVFASEKSNLKVVDANTSSEQTTFLKEDDSLWVLKDNHESIMVTDNIKEIIGQSYRSIFVLDNDNSLWLYEEDYSSAYREMYPFVEDFNDVFIDKYNKRLIAEDVIDASILNNNILYVNENHELILLEENIKYDEDTDSYSLSHNFLYTVLDTNASQVYYDYGNILVIKEDNSLWRSTLDDYFDDKDTKTNYDDNITKVTTGVIDAKLSYNSILVLNENNELRLFGDLDIPFGKEYFIEDKKDMLLLEDVKSFDFSSNSILAIKNDDSLWELNNENYFYSDKVHYDFEKVADDVSSIDTNYYTMVYVSKNGDLFGKGENMNGSLGDAETVYHMVYGEKGYKEVAENVEDVALSYIRSAIIKDDGSLWKTIDAYNIEEFNKSTEYYEKVADDVTWTNAMYYIAGDENYLYPMEAYLTPFFNDEYTDFLVELYSEIGVKDLTTENIYSVEKSEDILTAINSLSADELNDFEEKTNSYFENYMNNYNAEPIAENVLYSKDEYYLTMDNELYKIDSFDYTSNKIADDIVFFEPNYEHIIVKDINDDFYIKDLQEHIYFDLGEGLSEDEVNELVQETVAEYYGDDTVTEHSYSTFVEDDKFFDLNITLHTENKPFTKLDLPSNIDYVSLGSNEAYTLANDGTLTRYSIDFSKVEDWDKYNNDYTTAIFNNEYLTTEVIATNIKYMNYSDDALFFIDENDVLWAFGYFKSYLFTDNSINNNIDEPVKIMEDVKTAVSNYNNLLVLIKDGTLLATGDNHNGQLGFEPVKYFELTAVPEFTEIITYE